MNAVGTEYLNSNGVFTTRYFTETTIYGDNIKTSSGAMIDLATAPTVDDLTEINNKLIELDGKINTIASAVQNSAYAPDPFFAITNIESTTLTPLTFSCMRTHPFNNVSTLSNLKNLTFGSVEIIKPTAPVSTSLLYNIVDFCDRYFDFTINFNEINTSTELANGIPIFIPDRILNTNDGIVYKLRKLKAGGTYRGFNPSSTNVGHMYLFIRNVMNLVNNCLSAVFTAGSSAWSSSYLNIIFCGEIGLDSYYSSDAVNNNYVKCNSLWSPGRPPVIYQAIGIFMNNYYLVKTPGAGIIDFSIYLMNNTDTGKNVGTIWLPYFSCGNPSGGLKEDGTYGSSVLANSHYSDYATTLSYMGYTTNTHRFYAYVLYLSKI